MAHKTTTQMFWASAAVARGERPESGSAGALAKGKHYIAQKVIEEAYEVGLALEHESDENFAEEASQLIYWLSLAAAARGITLSDIESQL